MIAYDPCDEPAREIAIRAYLESGDRAAALRHFRQYRDVLDGRAAVRTVGRAGEAGRRDELSAGAVAHARTPVSAGR